MVALLVAVACAPARPLGAVVRSPARHLAAALFLAGWLACGCMRQVSTFPAVTPSRSGPGSISVREVRVTQGTGISVSGEARLPAGECIRTELLAGHQAVDWWPGEACVEADAGQWEIVVPLGRRGAPEQLDEAIEYEIHAWSPGDPQGTSTTFPFDLSGPPE